MATLFRTHHAEMLLNRKAASLCEFVFPGSGAKGYLVEPKRQVAKIIEQTGVNFRIHDLRRTFITIAESLDLSTFSVKALVNHKQADDVTSGYLQLSVERLRKPMEAISDFMLKAAGINYSDVVQLNPKLKNYYT